MKAALMLAALLARVARDYAYERAKPIAGNALAHLIRRDLAVAGKALVASRVEAYTVKASPGPSTWAAVPWLGFFDNLVTESARKGFYVVVFVNPDTQVIYLSLNQATAEVEQEFGRKDYLNVLRRRAADIRARLSDVLDGFSTEAIDLGSVGLLPEGYQAGHVCGLRFAASDLDNAVVEAALHRMLDLYSTLVDRGGVTPTDMLMADARSDRIDDARHHALCLRIERARSVRDRVVAGRQLVCDGCGLDPQKDYAWRGRAETVPLDVHYLASGRSLDDGALRRYRIPDDFALLCPTCHRVIHTQTDPSDLDALRKRIRFAHMRETLLTGEPRRPRGG